MLLGLDLGTSNVKALVTSASGEMLGQGSAPVRLFHVPHGGVEQDLEEIWAATLSAIQQALRAVNPAAILAVGVSSQGGALQLLDLQGRPRSRVISWLDQRGEPHDSALTAALGQSWFTERIGHGGAAVAIGQLLRLRQEVPGCLAPPNRVGFVGDCIVARLCGRAAHDGTSCGLTLLYNPTLRRYDPDVLRHLGVEEAQLPDLLSPRTAAGGVSTELSRGTGLPEGIPVSAAIHDQYTAALGTGAVRPGVTMLGAGTAWVLLAVSGRPAQLVNPDGFLNHHVVEGLYGQIVSLVNGGSALAWVSELLGVADSAEIDRLLESAPAGSNELLFWPFLAPTAAAGLAPGTRGRFSGLQLSHGRAEVARAVVEGLAFELKRHLQFFERAGIPIEKLVIGGSAAASRVTPQLLADVTDLPFACLGAGTGSLLGAAIIARGLLEPRRSLADLADEMLPPARHVPPGPDARAYAQRFPEYLKFLPMESRV
jgi:sugar (pentulose or hexulose) kinase